MKDYIKTEWDKVMDYSYGQMEINIKDSGSIILDMVKANYLCQMEINMKEIGKTTKIMEMETINGQMEINTMDNGKIIKEMEKDPSIGI